MEEAATAHCSHPECGLVPFNLPPTWPCGVCVGVCVSLCVCVCVDSLPYVVCVYVFCATHQSIMLSTFFSHWCKDSQMCISLIHTCLSCCIDYDFSIRMCSAGFVSMCTSQYPHCIISLETPMQLRRSRVQTKLSTLYFHYSSLSSNTTDCSEVRRRDDTVVSSSGRI